ncbi:monovalent cation/H(+) antiporter subunit G [Actinomycetospora chibensis]|uniref:Monovalent cation/H(+) antiporter subunit G n=1 Tax=Actinomycetospora chibensis TaxID=663606 RepID=A0ABV9RLK6_9PSEU|nr:monovalent cation/H(+) antiporter subunit G [Actinomycetospora chibensis]MDD7926172.1 monovalent cation/H(+) antiporter subunit G [Actinomycetospora chibensis]
MSTPTQSTVELVLDTIGTVAIVLGVLLALVASVGLLSLPDVLSRMHAATKPQVVGLLLIVIGGALHLRTSPDVWMLVLVGAFQLVTAPVTAHVVGRLAHRGEGGVRRDLLYVDELTDRPDEADPGPDDQEDDDEARDEDGSPHRNGAAVGRSRRRRGDGSDGASLDSGE